ncbi:diguanylate cyclase [Aeromonas hydrophila]
MKLKQASTHSIMNQNSPHVKSLTRNLLIALLFIGLVPLISVGFLAYQRSSQSLNDKAGSFLAAQAREAIDKIDRNLFERYSDVQMMALNPQALGPADSVSKIADIYTQAYGFYDLMVIADPEGNIIATNTSTGDGRSIDSMELRKTSVADTEWFRQAMSGYLNHGQSYYRDATYDPLLKLATGVKEQTLLFVAPIYAEDGKIVRIWANWVSFDRVVGEIMRSVRHQLLDTGNAGIATQVLSHDGVILYPMPDDDSAPQKIRKVGSLGTVGLHQHSAGFIALNAEDSAGKDQIVGYSSSKGILGFKGYSWSILIHQDLVAASIAAHDLRNFVVITSLVAFPFIFWLAFTISASFRKITEGRELALFKEAERQDFEARLHRALDSTESEEEAFAVVSEALALVTKVTPGEVLLADSSQMHFRQVAVAEPAGAPGCMAQTPRDCLAFRRGATLIFSDSELIDSCRKLRGRANGPCSAVCIPMTSMGKQAGVLHVAGAQGKPFDAETISRLQSISSRASTRIAMLRAMQETQLQAETDGLTGLLNRRSLENQARALLSRTGPVSVAFCDLDHFKLLNDSFGHEAGDRALRVFARVLSDVVRNTDIVGRYGGEEFVVILPEASVTIAVDVMNRVREQLELACMSGAMPAVTASFGVAYGEGPIEFDEIVHSADTALLIAKQTGRNRVVVAGTITDTSTISESSQTKRLAETSEVS